MSMSTQAECKSAIADEVEVSVSDWEEALKQVQAQAQQANSKMMTAMKSHYERRTSKAPTAEELFEEFRILRRIVCVDGASSDEWTEYEYDIPEESDIESEVEAVASQDEGASAVDKSKLLVPSADGAEIDEVESASGSEADEESSSESDGDLSLDEEELADVQNKIYEGFENVSIYGQKVREHFKKKIRKEFDGAFKRGPTAEEVDAVFYGVAKLVWDVQDSSEEEDQSQDESDSDYVAAVEESSGEEESVSEVDEVQALVADNAKNAVVDALTEDFIDGQSLPEPFLVAAGVVSSSDSEGEDASSTKPVSPLPGSTKPKPALPVDEHKAVSPEKLAGDAFSVTLTSGETVTVQLETESKELEAAQLPTKPLAKTAVSFLEAAYSDGDSQDYSLSSEPESEDVSDLDEAALGIDAQVSVATQ